jgi:hypothetical protein
MQEIPAGIGDFFMQTGYLQLVLTPIHATLDLATHALLQERQLLFMLTQMAGVLDDFAVRQRGKGFQTQINANPTAEVRLPFLWSIGNEHGKPLTRRLTLQRQSLYYALDFTMPPDAYVAERRHMQLAAEFETALWIV